ncbi:polysaccharide deacetylase family protein [Motiliproteus sediminis]|uniref:polysaccharide deacetylase family protein n=1 Tax=Motiliproteus sediminis TaxID=1468178 RepID=UPI001AEFCEC0|nr:polysaccharide deacetylase family protein [Motiliproteus sediminis]
MGADQTGPWQALAEELALWGQQGRCATLWWRDDDAERQSPQLARLDQLSRDYQVPLALAVIPQGADSSLCPLLAANPLLIAYQHGVAHRNHAPQGARKCELGDDRPLAAMVAELIAGRERLAGLLGDRFEAVLVPPWNRLSESLLLQLDSAGFTGLSTLAPRRRRFIRQLNVHVDLIDWRRGRCFAGDDEVLGQLIAHLRARRSGAVDGGEATGIMSHHLAHDEGCWLFLRQLFDFIAAQPHARWIDSRTEFRGDQSCR